MKSLTEEEQIKLFKQNNKNYKLYNRKSIKKENRKILFFSSLYL